MSEQLRVEAEVYPVVSHSMAHNRISPLRTVTLHNEGTSRIGAEVRILIRDEQGPLSAPFTTHADLAEGSATHLRDLAIVLDPVAMNEVEEARPGQLVVTVHHAGAQIGSLAQPVDVLAARQWLWRPPGLALELLAAHVMPNAPEVSALMDAVGARLQAATGHGHIDGYQSGPDRVDAIAHAVYDAIVDCRIRYSEPPASWADEGQKIRTPADLLRDRLGTCLDTTLLFAAALEQAGIRPLVWMLEGHSFVGWWRHEVDSWTAVAFDEHELVNRLDLGHLGIVETTLATDRPDPVRFEDACSAAERQLHSAPDAIIGVLDVWSARRSRILPLPAIARTPEGVVQSVVYQPAQHSVAPAEREDAPAPTSHAPVGDRSPVPPRVQRWKNALLDLSLRNRLINFSERSAVRLHVTAQRLLAIDRLVAAGRQVTLVPNDAFDDVYRHRDGIQRAADLPVAVLDEALDRRASIFTDLAVDTYLSQLRSLAYKARTVSEETGANNLYLVLGTLNWELDGRALRSPLILVPIHLKTSSGRGNYRIVLDETGAATPNYCLLEKLRSTHGVSLPALGDVPAAGLDVAEALRGVRESLMQKGLPFSVDDSAHISLLQFAKFRLWKDLDDNWQTLLAQPLAAHLAHTPTAEFADPVSRVAVDLEALSLQCPIPVDGSQLGAIADALAGRTFVLEGPPGTGKSQTIANLLARGMAEGKRVLFVAEKRAALDVVARRVRDVGLGPLTLDLHNRDSRPAKVRQQIATAMDLAARGDREGLKASTDQATAAAAALTRYASRLHDRNGAGHSLYSAVTARVALGEGDTLNVPTHVVAPGGEEIIATLRKLASELPYVADAARPSPTAPWAFARVDSAAVVDMPLVAQTARQIEALLQQPLASPALRSLVVAAARPDDLTSLGRVLDPAPMPLAVLDEVRSPRWSQAIAEAREALTAFAAAAGTRLGEALPTAFDLPLEDIDQRAQAAAQSSWFGRRKRLRAVVDEVRPALKQGAAIAPREIPELTKRLVDLRRGMHELAGRILVIPGLALPPGWNAATPEALLDFDQRVARLRDAAARTAPRSQDPFREALRRFLTQPTPASPEDLAVVGGLAHEFSRVQAALAADDDAMATWSGPAGLIGQWRAGGAARDAQDPELRSLSRWLALREYLRPFLSAGLEAVHGQLLSGSVPSDEAALALDRGISEASIIERRRSQGLDVFEEGAHNRTIERFVEHGGRSRVALRGTLAEQAVARRSFASEATSGQVGALRRELSRQRGGLSVRDLMAQFGALITETMPCVLVSPDSLARFFPVGSVDFDLVVFDEASQIRVADAIGAIGRARSVVVVGDSKQMPPTSFAEAALGGDDEDDDPVSGVVDDEESILSECVQARVPRRWLSWHYRSRDESLIAFSNARYYDGRLSSFPAPTRGSADPGVEGHGINLVRVDGTFLRSGKGKALRTNPVEAEAILAEVRRRFAAAPAGTMPSIGIVTFNAQQRVLIESMIRDTADPGLIAALDSSDGEGLFVKNLENVQGDERDAILFSTAFSVNDKGILPLNFGPLNLAGGERRLNVAITRARRQVILYSSFDPGQLRSEETSSQGIRHLREYLDVAAGGESELASTTGRSLVPDRHRDAIADALRARGVAVKTDVGLSDFRVDLLLASGDAPDQPLVAVLLDSPGWARRATVGDRDGLPTLVLGTMLKWPAVERVWLPSWLDAPEQVLERLIFRVGSARFAPPEQATSVIPDESEAEDDVPVSADPVPAPPASVPGAGGPERGRLAPARSASVVARPARAVEPLFEPWNPRIRGDVTDLDSLAYSGLARGAVRALLREGITAEGPIHGVRLAKKVANAFGMQKVHRSRVDSILELVDRRPDREGFFWPDALDPKDWRGYRRDAQPHRPLEHICPLELANAMREVARLSAGITSDELKKATSEEFGFRRLTAGMTAILDDALDLALVTGRLRRRGQLLHAD